MRTAHRLRLHQLSRLVEVIVNDGFGVDARRGGYFSRDEDEIRGDQSLRGDTPLGILAQNRIHDPIADLVSHLVRMPGCDFTRRDFLRTLGALRAPVPEQVSQAASAATRIVACLPA